MIFFVNPPDQSLDFSFADTRNVHLQFIDFLDKCNWRSTEIPYSFGEKYQ